MDITVREAADGPRLGELINDDGGDGDHRGQEQTPPGTGLACRGFAR
jgi:hypothetical protein